MILGDYDGVPAYALFTGQTCHGNSVFEVSSMEEEEFQQALLDYAAMRNLTAEQTVKEVLRVGLTAITANILKDVPELKAEFHDAQAMYEQIVGNIMRDMAPKWRAMDWTKHGDGNSDG